MGGPLSRQSEPVIRRDVFPSSPHDRHSMQPAHHQFDYSMSRPSQDFSRHNESNFSNEGFLPSLQEADRFFGNGFTPQDDFSIMSSDSRLSFGMRHHPPPPQQQQQQQQQHHPMLSGHFQDPIYETLSSYKHDASRRWSSNVSTVSAPNLSTASSGRPRRGDPPPLPPKPRLMTLKPEMGFGIQNPGNLGFGIQNPGNLASEVGMTRTDERGYSVSFV
jgi:hypothetical protein